MKLDRMAGEAEAEGRIFDWPKNFSAVIRAVNSSYRKALK